MRPNAVRLGLFLLLGFLQIMPTHADQGSQPPSQPASTVNQPDASQVRIPWVTQDLNAAIIRYKGNPGTESFNAILAVLPQSRESAGTEEIVTYTVEGDMQLELTDVCRWVERITGVKAPSPPCNATAQPDPRQTGSSFRPELRVYNCDDQQAQGGVASCIWRRPLRGQLSYEFDTESFRANNIAPNDIDRFKATFHNAVEAWNRACPLDPCNLQIHHPEEQYAGGSPLTHFVVKYDSTDSKLVKDYYAFSFFRVTRTPHAIRVGARFFRDDDGATEPRVWRRTLRHELGHVLGYAHEQLAIDVSGVNCPTEFQPDAGAVGVDRQAPFSAGSIMLQTACGPRLPDDLTTDDILRHQQIYGAP